MNDSIKKFIENGGEITILPKIAEQKDRQKINAKRPPRKQKTKEPTEPLTGSICSRCISENGKPSARCLRCKHYKRFNELNDLQNTICFDHLPQAIFENIAELPKGNEIISKIRKLPLDKSVPLMMQYVLNATIKEIAEYHKITRQAVAYKNKITLTILKTLVSKQ